MNRDFDMIVMGGGAAGLTAAGISISLGAKTALIEARKLGGDCTWYGCVPSKTLLKAAKIVRSIRHADRYGLRVSEPQFSFAEVMEHVHAIRARIYEEADAPPIFEKLGVEVIQGQARFLDAHTIECTDSQGATRGISSRYFVIATGSVPVIPPFGNRLGIPALTNETIFSLTEMPKRLIVVGAGPIGMEMGQAFARFGSQVVVIGSADRILPRDDPELACLLREQLASEGMEFVLESRATQAEGGSAIRIVAESRSGRTQMVEGDAVLFAAGRRSNVEALDLSRAGVAVYDKGIVVDRHCRTSVKHIYATGDVTGRYQFTHMAEHMSKVATTHALLHLPVSVEDRSVAWCTFTDPELAHAGLTEQALRKTGKRFAVYRFPFTKIDRAVTDNETAGLIKVFARPFDGRIYGASILGANAGEMIGEYALAIRNRVTLRQIADTIHPYPTYALGNRRAADQWYVRKQSQTVVRWIQRLFGYRGPLPDTSDPNRIV